MSRSGDDGDRPALRIVRGEPTAEELAALTALVTAAGTDDPAPSEPPSRGGWGDPTHRHVAMPRPGPGAWVSSFR